VSIPMHGGYRKGSGRKKSYEIKREWDIGKWVVKRMKPTGRERGFMKCYTCRLPKSKTVELVIGNQGFNIGEYEKRPHGDWMRLMLARALIRLVERETETRAAQ